MQESYKMAGRVAAHAVLSVCDGELLIPIYGYLGRDGKTNMVRVVSPTAEQAMAEGERMYDQNPNQATAGVWVVDGFITLPEVGKVDALLLNICTYGLEKSELQLAIPYRHALSSEGFSVFNPKLLNLQNLQSEQIPSIMDAFFEGRDEHTDAAKIWKASQQGQPTSVSGFSGFSTGEWASLRNAPLAIFFMVASADGDIDEKEIKAFGDLFKESGKYPSVLMQRVMLELSPHVRQGRELMMEFLVHFSSGQFSVAQYFAGLSRLLADNAEDEAAAAFKRDLLAFASAVAASSGGGFLGFGSKISKQEKAVISVIETLLMSPPEVGEFMATLASPT
ncbi:hypothetical protein BVH01_01890 [Pseudomonas sp. PA1(2017)]|uniref:hypothetical protein n=1 Tax=Pseudomonas sp. PA1(2017) TaxID=1932113 RepID=UPI00095F1F56|nr:hypothetical protein [Pseudomonas sp. PA1(2017)]OLU20714.1 hypothetical protein BVH01_01890 [Pseudomonas sp. PA1(2017)]